VSRLAAVVAGALLLAGCLGPAADPGAEGGLDLQRRVGIPPRGAEPAVVELDLRMQANATIHFRWNATLDVAFDVHSHGAGGEAWTHLRHFGRAYEGGFTAPAPGVYSLMWENFGPDGVMLEYAVTGEAEPQA
jgi:hypothetical protein